MNPSLAHRGFIGVALVLAVLSVALGLSNFMAAQDSWVIQNMGRVRAVTMSVAPAILISMGLALSVRSAVLGGVLALIGAAAFAVLMAWTIFIPLLAALAVVFWLVAHRSTRALEGRK